MYILTELLMCVLLSMSFCTYRTCITTGFIVLTNRLSSSVRLCRWKDAAATWRGTEPDLSPLPLLSPTPDPPPLPRPSEPLASPSHHEPAVSWAPKAAGGVSHGRRAAHLALPAGWKPGEWVRVQIHLWWFSPMWESTPCNYHGDSEIWKAKRWFIKREWSCGSGQRDASIQPARTENINYQLLFPSIRLLTEYL